MWACFCHVQDLSCDDDWKYKQRYPGWVAFNKICRCDSQDDIIQRKGSTDGLHPADEQNPVRNSTLPSVCQGNQKQSEKNLPAAAMSDISAEDVPVLPSHDVTEARYSMSGLLRSLSSVVQAPHCRSRSQYPRPQPSFVRGMLMHQCETTPDGNR